VLTILSADYLVENKLLLSKKRARILTRSTNKNQQKTRFALLFRRDLSDFRPTDRTETIKAAFGGLIDLTTLHPAFSSLFGGGKRDRTADLLHAMQALSQLSYTPLAKKPH
jgi:hypothetical protein